MQIKWDMITKYCVGEIVIVFFEDNSSWSLDAGTNLNVSLLVHFQIKAMTSLKKKTN